MISVEKSHDMEPMSYIQIAIELGIDVAQVKRIERMALFKLKQNPELWKILLDMPPTKQYQEDDNIFY